MAGLRDNQATEAITAELKSDRLEAFGQFLGHVDADVAEALDGLKLAERYASDPYTVEAIAAARLALAQAARHLAFARSTEVGNG